MNGNGENSVLSPALACILGTCKTIQISTLTIPGRRIIRSTVDAVALLGASRSTVFRWVKQDKLPALQMDHRIRLLTNVTVPPRLCGQCGREIVDRPPNARFCKECSDIRKKESSLRFYRSQRGEQSI